MHWCWWWHKVAQYATLTSSTSLQEHFFTPAVFGEIIYENFLFDIPKLLDLCVLFGKGNGQLLHKMIGELCARSHLCFIPVVALCSLSTWRPFREHLYSAAVLLQRPGWDGAHSFTGESPLLSFHWKMSQFQMKNTLYLSDNILMRCNNIFFFNTVSTSGIWHDPGEVWSPMWRSHRCRANEAECTQKTHCHDHEPAGQSDRCISYV